MGRWNPLESAGTENAVKHGTLEPHPVWGFKNLNKGGEGGAGVIAGVPAHSPSIVFTTWPQTGRVPALAWRAPRPALAQRFYPGVNLRRNSHPSESDGGGFSPQISYTVVVWGSGMSPETRGL